MAKTPKNYIPGFATYFWLIPEHSALATISFQHVVNGHQGMQMFMKEFLAKFTRFVVGTQNPAEGTTNIIGYRESPADDVVDLIPVFHSKLALKPGRHDFIRKNCTRIVKIIRTNELNPVITNRHQLLADALKTDLGMSSSATNFMAAHVRYEISHTPTISELDDIIGNWESQRGTRWDDVGFKFSGKDEIYWLSRSLVKQEVELDIEWDSEETVNGRSLLKELEAHRPDLLRGLLRR